MEQYLELAKLSARRAGACLSSAYSADAGVVSEMGKDIKTEADRAAERVILEGLRPSGLSILSEECGLELGAVSGGAAGKTPELFMSDASRPYWVIDPLDGTFNFTRGFPVCCVSIGLWSGKRPVLGVIYDFVSDAMYSGVVGMGAFCNDRRMEVSKVSDLSKAVLMTGFPSARDYSEAALADSIRSVQRFKKIRMIGSAASSLAHVAAGHADAYMEEDIWLWDVAAGLALVKAAGGGYQISKVKESWQMNVFAGNGCLKPG